jgi:hypothetical protein
MFADVLLRCRRASENACISRITLCCRTINMPGMPSWQ